MEREVKLYEGGLGVDDRGTVAFCNDFKFENVKRFYTVDNSDYMFIRAWHGHKNEGKYVTVVAGTAIVGLIDLRGWTYCLLNLLMQMSFLWMVHRILVVSVQCQVPYLHMYLGLGLQLLL